jgi:tetratricopeptide (TPR) repeat protein
MQQGTFALQAGRYGDAAFAFREALRLVPGDPQAAQGLQEAQAGLEEEIKLKRDFDRLMQSGTTAAQQQRYAEAINFYMQAQKLFPGDQRLLRLISQAKYANAMNEGQAALRSKRYADAVTCFEQALLESPGDFAATSLLRQAQALNR